MFDFAKTVLGKKIEQLESTKTKKYLEKENVKKAIENIDTYFDLQNKRKDNKNTSLFYLSMAIIFGIGGFAFSPLFVVSLAFSIASMVKTKETMKLKRRIEKEYKEFLNQSPKSILNLKESLSQKMKDITPIYDGLSNMIAKSKFYLQQLNDCQGTLKKENNIEDMKKEIENYFHLNQSLESYLNDWFDAANINYHNDIRSENIMAVQKVKTR